MNTAAAAKIKMLKGSMKCFVFGLISLVALVGVPFAVMAVAGRDDNDDSGFAGFCFFISVLSLAGLPFAAATVVVSTRARRNERNFWNAAKPYRILGDVCASLAFIASFIVGTLCGFMIVDGHILVSLFR